MIDVQRLIEQVGMSVDAQVVVTYDGSARPDSWRVKAGGNEAWGRDLESVLLHLATMGLR